MLLILLICNISVWCVCEVWILGCSSLEKSQKEAKGYVSFALVLLIFIVLFCRGLPSQWSLISPLCIEEASCWFLMNEMPKWIVVVLIHGWCISSNLFCNAWSEMVLRGSVFFVVWKKRLRIETASVLVNKKTRALSNAWWILLMITEHLINVDFGKTA